jgi:hypothetical protein
MTNVRQFCSRCFEFCNILIIFCCHDAVLLPSLHQPKRPGREARRQILSSLMSISQKYKWSRIPKWFGAKTTIMSH